MRPEHIVAIGLRITDLQNRLRISMITNVFTLVRPHIHPEKFNDFALFYRKMLLGIDAVAREQGAERKTSQDLQNYLNELDLPDSIRMTSAMLISQIEPILVELP